MQRRLYVNRTSVRIRNQRPPPPTVAAAAATASPVTQRAFVFSSTVAFLIGSLANSSVYSRLESPLSPSLACYTVIELVYRVDTYDCTKCRSLFLICSSRPVSFASMPKRDKKKRHSCSFRDKNRHFTFVYINNSRMLLYYFLRIHPSRRINYFRERKDGLKS